MTDKELRGSLQEYGNAANVVRSSQVEHTYLALLWAKPPQETLKGLLEVYNCINATNAAHVWISEDTQNLNVPVAAIEYSSKKYLRFDEL